MFMCWFHVIYNIRKHKSLIPDDLYEAVVDDIHNLHYKPNEVEFRITKINILKKWRSNSELVAFSKYFDDQWLNGPFNNWQIFKTPAGIHITFTILSFLNLLISDLRVCYIKSSTRRLQWLY